MAHEMLLVGCIVLISGIITGVQTVELSRDFAKSKCDRRVKNQTELQKCKECIEAYKLPEKPSKTEIRRMLRRCIPKKPPKEWMKARCEDTTGKQDEIQACYECVDKFALPQNVTRDDMRQMKKTCLPKPSLKFKAKKKCSKTFDTKLEIEECQNCIERYNLPEKASCDEVKEMKEACISKRSGKALWTEPLLLDDDDGDGD